MSHVIKVEHELNTDESELINAANNPATTIPFKPAGNKAPTNVGRASSGLLRVMSPL